MVTIIPAIADPIITKGKAFLNEIPKTNAAIAPVQPPTKGIGVATKIITVKPFPHFSNFDRWTLLVWAKSQIKNWRKKKKRLLRSFENGSNSQIIKIKGTKFPRTEKK